MNKAKLIVTRVFDSERTPQDAFVRAILNSNKYEKNLQVSGSESIILFLTVEKEWNRYNA